MIYINESGSEISPQSVIKLTGISKQTNGSIYVTADQPDSAVNFLLAVTGNEKVADGNKGWCEPLAPTFLMTYDTGDGTPANEENWGADNGTFKLKKNFGGGNYAVIGADTENEVALVMRTGKVSFRGKTDSGISAGAFGVVNIYSGAIDSETDTGDTVSALNRDPAESIGADKWVDVERMNSGWEASVLEC